MPTALCVVCEMSKCVWRIEWFGCRHSLEDAPPSPSPFSAESRASLLLHLLTPAPRLTFIIYRTLSFAHFNSLVQNRAASERTSLLIRVALPHNYTRSLESSATFVLVGKSRDISRENMRWWGSSVGTQSPRCMRWIHQ